MIVVAIILLVAIGAVLIGALLAETEPAGFEVLQESFTVPGGALVAVGLLLGVGGVAVVWMLRIGLRRAAERRRELYELRTAHEKQKAALELERQALEEEKAELRGKGLVRPYVGSRPDRTPEPAERKLPGSSS